MRSSAVVALLVASSVFAAPLTRRQNPTTTAAAPTTDTSGESAFLDGNIPILQALAEMDPTDPNAVAAIQQQLATLPADQQQAITQLISSVGQISQQFATVSDDDMHLIENYVTKNLTPLQMEFITNELTQQPAPNQPGGPLSSDLSSAFKALPTAERKALTLMALVIDASPAQTKYITKELSGGSTSSSAASSGTAAAASVGDGTTSTSTSGSSKSSKKKSSSKDSKKKSSSKDSKKKSSSKDSKKKSSSKDSKKKSSSSSSSDDSDDSASASSTSASSGSSSGSSSSSATPSAADIQAQLACLSPSDAQSLISQLQAQGASASDIQSVEQQIPSLQSSSWTAPSSCSASKRSLADLD